MRPAADDGVAHISNMSRSAALAEEWRYFCLAKRVTVFSVYDKSAFIGCMLPEPYSHSSAAGRFNKNPKLDEEMAGSLYFPLFLFHF